MPRQVAESYFVAFNTKVAARFAIEQCRGLSIPVCRRERVSCVFRTKDIVWGVHHWNHAENGRYLYG